MAFSSSLTASYVISVRRASALPAASFRFHLAMDTLAVRLTIPPVGFVGDFHSQVRAPCRAHVEKRLPLPAAFRSLAEDSARAKNGSKLEDKLRAKRNGSSRIHAKVIVQEERVGTRKSK